MVSTGACDGLGGFEHIPAQGKLSGYLQGHLCSCTKRPVSL